MSGRFKETSRKTPGEQLATELEKLGLKDLVNKDGQKLQAIRDKFPELSGSFSVLLDLETKRVIEDMVVRGCRNTNLLVANLREAGVDESVVQNAIDEARKIRLSRLNN